MSNSALTFPVGFLGGLVRQSSPLRRPEAPALAERWYAGTGLSNDFAVTTCEGDRVRTYHYAPLSYAPPVEMEFQSLAIQWKSDTMYASSISKIISHPAYRRIIGLGWDIIPLILADLKQTPSFWFDALTAITGIQPISPEHAGDMDAMANDWLGWGLENGLIR